LSCDSFAAVASVVETLRKENTALQSQLRRREEELQSERHEKGELAKRNEILGEENAWLKARLFGPKSEKLAAEDIAQMRLFNEAEVSAAEPQPHEQLQKVSEHSRRHPVRRPLPESLPREEVLIDIPEADKQCACGHQLVQIGVEPSEKLDVIPPRMRVIRTLRPKYVCHHCEGSGDEERRAVRIAPMPPTLIPKGIAAPGLLAYIVTAKFCDALPLYRQEKQFLRYGIELPRQTMADWMIAVAKACTPVMDALEKHIRSGPILNVDETTVEVLGEAGRANTTKSYMWVARGGPAGGPEVVLYRYAPSRGAEVARQIIGDFNGYLQTDGYDAYDVVASERPELVHVGCLAHVRRDFFDAKKNSKKAGSADEALAMIDRLYAMERRRGDYKDVQQFAAARKAEVQPVLEKLHAWLLRKQTQVLPGSLLGEAVNYALGQWPKLLRYLEHPDLTPDNNACEQAIRPFVIGRKNWMFAGSPRGADASAALYTLIETAKANGLEPYWYLRRLFEKLPSVKTPEDLLPLLPFVPNS
jgi:transposase